MVIARSVNSRQTHCTLIVSGPTLNSQIHWCCPHSEYQNLIPEGFLGDGFSKCCFEKEIHSGFLSHEVSLAAPCLVAPYQMAATPSCMLASMRVCWPGPDLEVIRTQSIPNLMLTSSSHFFLFVFLLQNPPYFKKEVSSTVEMVWMF